MNLIELSNSVREVQIYVTVYHTQKLDSGLKNNMMTMCIGTLDVALSRFNTALLRCQQHPLIADQYYAQLKTCTRIINRFYRWTIRFKNWPTVISWLPVLVLDWIGRRHIPKFKKLHDNLITTLDDSV